MGNRTGRLFKELDLDEDGSLTKDELKTIARTTPFYKEVEELLIHFDTDEDQKVSLSEFRKGIEVLKITDKQLKDCLERIKASKKKLKEMQKPQPEPQAEAAPKSNAPPQLEKEVKSQSPPGSDDPSLSLPSDTKTSSKPKTNPTPAPAPQEVDRDVPLPAPGSNGRLSNPFIRTVSLDEPINLDGKGLDGELGSGTGDVRDEDLDLGERLPDLEEMDFKSRRHTVDDPSAHVEKGVQNPISSEAIRRTSAPSIRPADSTDVPRPNIQEWDGSIDNIKSGDSVMVWSVKRKRWFNGQVVDVDEKGSVRVKYSRGSLSLMGDKWISRKEISVMLRIPLEHSDKPTKAPNLTTGSRSRSYHNTDLDKHSAASRAIGAASKSVSGPLQATGDGKSTSKPKPKPKPEPKPKPKPHEATGDSKSTSKPKPKPKPEPEPKPKPKPHEDLDIPKSPKAPSIRAPSPPGGGSSNAGAIWSQANSASTPKLSPQEAKNLEMLIAVQKCLPANSKINLNKKSRSLIRHGPVLRKGGIFYKATNGYLFLFDDLVVVCQDTSRRGSLNSPPAKPVASTTDHVSSLPVNSSKPQEESETESKPNAKTDTNTDPKTDAKTEVKSDTKTEQPKPDTKVPIVEKEDENRLAGIPADLKVIVREVFLPEWLRVEKGAASGYLGKHFSFGFSLVCKTLPPDHPVAIPGASAPPANLALGTHGWRQENAWCLALARCIRSRIIADDIFQAAKQHQSRVKRRPYGWATLIVSNTIHNHAFKGDVHAFRALLQSTHATAGATVVSRLLESRELAEGATPLLLGVARGHLEIVEACIENKADLEASDNKNRFPLLIAVARRRLDIAKALLKAGAKANRPLADGSSFLFGEIKRKDEGDETASIPSRADWVNTLIRYKALPMSKEKNSWGSNALHLALEDVSGAGWGPAAVPILIKNRPALVRQKNREGATPLHVAARLGSPEIIKALLGAGALPNVRIPRQWKTPLHMAHRAPAAAMLLKAGSRADLTSKNGKPACNPTELARKNKRYEHMLLDAQSFWNALDETPPSPDLLHAQNPSEAHQAQSKSDTICTACGDKFNSFRRWRYECGRCGISVCAFCSTKRVKDSKDNHPRRVCDGCYNLCRVRAFGSVKAWGVKKEREGKRRQLGIQGSGQVSSSGAGSAVAGGTGDLMRQNLRAMSERGERLNQMEDTSAKVAEEAQEFANHAKLLRQKMQSSWF